MVRLKSYSATEAIQLSSRRTCPSCKCHYTYDISVTATYYMASDAAVASTMAGLLVRIKALVVAPFFRLFHSRTSRGVLCPACQEFAPKAAALWFPEGYRSYLLRRLRRQCLTTGFKKGLLYALIVLSLLMVPRVLQGHPEGTGANGRGFSAGFQILAWLAMAAATGFGVFLGWQKYTRLAPRLNTLTEGEAKTAVVVEYYRNRHVLVFGLVDLPWLKKFMDIGPAGRAGLASSMAKQQAIAHMLTKCPQCAAPFVSSLGNMRKSKKHPDLKLMTCPSCDKDFHVK